MRDKGKMVCNLELMRQKVNEKAKLKTEEIGRKKKKNREFKQPEHDENMNSIIQEKFAPHSRRKIMWAVNLYSNWHSNRIYIPGCPPEIVNANLECVNAFAKSDLCYSMIHFVREVKKLDGIEYPPNTIRELVIMVQMYLHERGVFWKLLDEAAFVCLRNSMDKTMKERHSAGLGVCKSSDVISLEHENKLFN